ncbi:MAG: HAD-IA family hydrolase [Desulfobacterales bacterium]|nr:HAD-IA family hydrolase [Desulfobacterales bacterium]
MVRDPMTGRGVIWDLDGVLADTAEAHFQAWARALSAWKIPFDRLVFDRVFGMNNVGTLTVLLGRPPTQEEVTDIADYKEQLFRQLAGRLVRPMPGAIQLLDELAQAGWSQAVASSAPQGNIDLLVDAFGIRRYFAAILSGARLPAGKPDPALFLAAARVLRLSPELCVVVEDAPVGVEAAYRAGMPCIAVAATRPQEALGPGPVFDALTSVTEAAFSDALRAGPQGGCSKGAP